MSTNTICALGLALIFLASGFVEEAPAVAVAMLAPIACVLCIIVWRNAR